MLIRFLCGVLLCVFFSSSLIAETYIREYTYKASEADSKLTARAIALQEVKRELLNELGTHVRSLVKINRSSDGANIGNEEIETLSAGVTNVEVLNEQWNGQVYILKAQIKANPEDVLKSLHKILDADKKEKEIAQLNSDLLKLRKRNINIIDSLKKSKKDTTTALAEITNLKKELKKEQTAAARQKLQLNYQQLIDILTINELNESAISYYNEGQYQAAFPLLKKISEQGNTVDQYHSGQRYTRGNAYAQFYLGQMYYRGEGVDRDAAKAAHWYQKAANRGKVNYFDQFDDGVKEARINLGKLYLSGEGVFRDVNKAVYWWQKAAELGFEEAQNLLGQMYYEGTEVTRDENKAAYWYQKSAKQGNAKALKKLTYIKTISKEAE